MTNEVRLEESTKSFSAETLTSMIADSQISVTGFYNNEKASEKYVVIFYNGRTPRHDWVLPFYYRRTNTRIDSATELCDFIKTSTLCLSNERISAFQKEISKNITSFFGNAKVTIPIFKMLLNKCGEWVSNKDFKNPNPQRRIQDIKEKGFTLVTKRVGIKTFHALLPFPPVTAPTYETIPAKTRKAILKALNSTDAYSGKKSSISVLPDHKFPEIRWDKETAVSNKTLSPDDMREKFQLVPESINQAKREVCRQCFQLGSRGRLNSIDFFYKGDAQWPKDVPTTGKLAEQGCVGCFWYDMSEWRKALNNLIKGCS